MVSVNMMVVATCGSMLVVTDDANMTVVINHGTIDSDDNGMVVVKNTVVMMFSI